MPRLLTAAVLAASVVPLSAAPALAVSRSVAFSSSGSSTTETGTHDVTVVLTTPGPLLGDVIVNVTDDGTGSAGGADYTFTSPTQVTFLAGSTNGATETATITITDDDFDESNETIDLSLSLNSAPLDTIVASSITSHTVTITDDDTAGVTVFPMSVTVTEGGTTDSYTVVLESQPANNVTIIPSTNNGEVTVSPNSHTFVPGNWDQAETFIVTAVDDGDV